MKNLGCGEDGFSLVEVLVAFAVLAGALLAGFRVFGDGIYRISAGQERIAVLNVLRGQLSEEMARISQTAGERRGTTGGVAWVVTVSTAGLSASQAPFSAMAWRLRIAEDRPDGTAQVLETIVIAPAP